MRGGVKMDKEVYHISLDVFIDLDLADQALGEEVLREELEELKESEAEELITQRFNSELDKLGFCKVGNVKVERKQRG